MRRLIVLLILFPLYLTAQKKQISLEDIYKNRVFQGAVVPGFSEQPIDSLINTAEVLDETGKKLETRDNLLSTDKKKVLFFTGRESIYRHSSKAYTYLFDVYSKKTTRLNKEKILHATFSPDGNKIAYVHDNNLYLYDIPSGQTRAVTTDGRQNHIINGNCDWVYEEEFGFTQAYQWSPAGHYLAFYRFDESNVKQFTFTQFGALYDSQYIYKYPKAGEGNSRVEICIYNIADGRYVKAQYEQGDIYIPRIKWTRDDKTLCIFRMNRHQNQLQLLLTHANTGSTTTLYEENNKYYIDINDDWQFLNDGKSFLFTSEMNGYQQIYLYSMDGKTKTLVSKLNYDVAEINGVDEKNKLVYYTVAYPRPMDRNLFVSDFSGNKTRQLTQGEGWHRIVFNPDFTQFYDYYSTLTTPQTVTLNEIISDKKKGIRFKEVKLVNDNSRLRGKMEEYDLSRPEFIRIPNSKGDTLNGWMLKPVNFDPQKKYPVLFCNYGGPGSQQVSNRFGAVNFWHQMLAQRGFIVASVDNTGTGFRGEEFKKKTYLQLGKYELEDQMDAAKYFSAMSYVDKNNIGHWGWSYGGFMSSLAITKGSEVFTAAIAVAPVTSWRYYDNIYTERYMRTPEENPKGYDDNSPVNFTDRIKGKYLIIHGTADDNVHFQNSVHMIKAMVKNNVNFESAYYPDKNHGISGMADNTTFHLWSKMTRWISENLGNENTQPLQSSRPGPLKGF